MPGLKAENRETIQKAFESLFYDLTGYKRSLNQVFQQRVESMYMLIFNDATVTRINRNVTMLLLFLIFSWPSCNANYHYPTSRDSLFKLSCDLVNVIPSSSHNREVKHDVYGKRQTAKMKLLPSAFSTLYSGIKTFVLAVNSKRQFSIFV